MGFPLSCSALAPRKAIPCLLARFRDFARPQHAPRSPGGTQTCAVVYRRAPVPHSREREGRPVAGREEFCIPETKSVRLRTPRARATEPGRDPNLGRGVQADPRVSQPRARGKTRGRKRKVLYSGNKVNLVHSTTSNAQSTRHGAGPGPKLAPWCTGGPLFPAAESARKDPRPEEKSCVFRKKSEFGTTSSNMYA